MAEGAGTVAPPARPVGQMSFPCPGPCGLVLRVTAQSPYLLPPPRSILACGLGAGNFGEKTVGVPNPARERWEWPGLPQP